MRLFVLTALFGTLLAHGEDCGPAYVSAPRYPLLAFQARVSGRVEIEMEVRANGSIGGFSRFDGDNIFRAASESAARVWKFQPGSDRKCVATIVYRIMPVGTPPEELTTRFEPPLLVEVRRETAEPTVLVDPAPVRAKRK